MRRLTCFPCAGETLVGTIDDAPGTSGLLIVSGGNELRAGAHRGMALLARRVSDAGFPVFRYDRRGVGDSTGSNAGFRGSADDLLCAAHRFRQEAPQVGRIVAFGNCDAATALALFHQPTGIDRLVLANPWTMDQADALPPPAAIRARYAERLRDPATWWRLLRGGVDLRKLAGGLTKLARSRAAPATLAAELGGALAAARVPVTVLLAEGDATAIAYADAARGACFTAASPRIVTHTRASASHSFAAAGDADWLFAALLAELGAG